MDPDEAVRFAVAELENVVEDRDTPAPSASTGGPAPTAPSGVFGAN